jgi:hypothetical protein
MALDLARYGRRIEQIPNIVFGVACWWHMGSGGRGGQVQVCVAMPCHALLRSSTHYCLAHLVACTYLPQITPEFACQELYQQRFSLRICYSYFYLCAVNPDGKPEPIYRFRDQDRKFLSFATMKHLQLAPCPLCNVDGNSVVN